MNSDVFLSALQFFPVCVYFYMVKYCVFNLQIHQNAFGGLAGGTCISRFLCWISEEDKRGTRNWVTGWNGWEQWGEAKESWVEVWMFLSLQNLAYMLLQTNVVFFCTEAWWFRGFGHSRLQAEAKIFNTDHSIIKSYSVYLSRFMGR